MGIDIYARWHGQSTEERNRQSSVWLETKAGRDGYLREAYHGEPYATHFMFAEAFDTGMASIPAAVLRGRLDTTLRIVAKRERTLYHSTAEQIEEAKQNYRDFVALCERMEAKTGEPVEIVASY